MSEQHYTGSCQCGAVTYEVDVDLDHSITCNCSRCRRVGSVLAFAPRDKFTLRSGEDALSEYRFNSKILQHLFCTTCGVQSFSFGEKDGQQMVAVNTNTLDGVDARALHSTAVDGASF